MTLVIDYLEIENFKSYYGKNKLGPFHQSFNAVIGPNGSGKSNVIDSLLFVFGFRAQKIRTKKISVLIHNSDQHPNVTSCSVTIFFQKIKQVTNSTQTQSTADQGQGQKQFEIIPGSKFTVKRTAYKDNSSDYHIDERKVPYKEVGNLLRSHGVDLDHNRFLILQGEVESISLLKPKASATANDEGLLEYLEDIIGTIRYRPLLDEITEEIDRANESRMEKSNRVQNLAKDKDSLEGPKNEAIKYLRMENALIEKKNFYYQLKRKELSEVLAEREASCAELKTQLDELVGQLDELKTEAESETTEVTNKRREYEKKMRHMEKTKRKLEDLEKEDVKLKESAKHASEAIAKLSKQVENDLKKVEELANLPERNEELIEGVKEDLVELEASVDPANHILQEKMEQVNVETKECQEKKNALQEELIALQTKSNEAKSNVDMAQSELDCFLNDETYERKKLEETRAKLKDLVKLDSEREKSLSMIEYEAPRHERNLEKLSGELEQTNKREKELQEGLAGAKQKCTEIASSAAASRNKNKVLAFLTQLRAEGQLDGFYGRLGDLGAIDDKFDVAVSTAGGGALDYMLVNTIETAQACTQQLKANKVGQASFLVLDKQDRWINQVNKRQEWPEKVDRLVDLVKVNDRKFLPAFYYAMRDTLVANDLEQASRIGLQGSTRYRVVSLRGEVVEPSGTMSGGGRPLSGRMGSSIQQQDDSGGATSVREMQEQIRRDEQELHLLVNKRMDLDPRVCELKITVDENKANVTKWTNERKMCSQQIDDLRLFETECAARVQQMADGADTEKKQSLETNLAKFQSEFTKTDKNAAKLRETNEQLHAKILEIRKKILDGPKKECARIEKSIAEKTSELTSLTVEIKTSKRQLANTQKKLEQAKNDLAANEKAVAKSEGRIEALDDDLSELREQYTLGKEECDAWHAEMSEANKAIKKFEARKQKLEAERIDLAHEFSKQFEEREHLAKEARHCAEAGRALRLHDLASIESVTGPTDSEEGENEATRLKIYDAEEMEEANLEQTRKEMHKLDEKLKEQTPNLNVIKNYREMHAKFMERVDELELITEARDEACNKFEEMRKSRLDEFMDGFTRIRLKLKEIYRTVTLEGDAELELVDSLDPFTEGIVLSVRPPKKSWKNVCNLSGGEKTLSSLSLVFALHEFRATPIYVMDEIDAALDFKNVSIIAHYIKERTNNAQFIIISLRNNMFELCDRLFGIYKVRNCTSATFIAPELMELDEKKTKNNTKVLSNNNSNSQKKIENKEEATSDEKKHNETEKETLLSTTLTETPTQSAPQIEAS